MKAQHVFLLGKVRAPVIAGATAVGLMIGGYVGFQFCQARSSSAQVIASVKPQPGLDAVTQEAVVRGMLSPDYFLTQVDIIRSDRVAQQAAKIMAMDKDPIQMAAYRAANQPVTPLVYFGRILQKHVQVVPSIGSRVITIQYTGKDAEESTLAANAWAKAYQDVSVELATSPSRQADAWYKQNIDTVRGQLETAQHALAVRQLALGVTAPIGTSPQAAAAVEPDGVRLSALSQGMAAAQAIQTSANSRTGDGALPDVTANPVIQQLDATIKGLGGQRSQLAARLGPNASEMREMDSQIAGLTRERNTQAGLIERTTAAAARQASGNVGQLEGKISGARTQVIESQAQRGELGALQQNVEALRVAYDNLVSGQVSSRMAGSGEQTNVSILAPATPKPCTGLVSGMACGLIGAILGALMGAVLAVLLELPNRRIRICSDAPELLGVPDLGHLHLITPSLLSSPSRFSRWQFHF